MAAKPDIVLVHGAWADGSCWSRVIERLQSDGYKVTAPQLPETSLAADVARVRHVLTRQNGPTALKSAPVVLGGVMAYYDHYWCDKFESTVGYSRTQVKNTNAQTGTAFHTGQYASGNIVYRPNPEVFFGAEFLWGQRTDNSGAKGIDRRLQFSAHYNFSTKALFAKS